MSLATVDPAAFMRILGERQVITTASERELLSQDLWWPRGHIADLVLVPRSTDDLQRILCEADRLDLAVAVRGGGMSYTGGYAPARSGTILLDLRSMNEILEVNELDMTVTVQAGCTWKRLHDELMPRALRTPFWGPMSGIAATVGGSVSQLGVLFGSGHYGTVSESVVGLEVVLADGKMLRTGARCGERHPFFRHYGPDLTALFCGDCGAFGVKSKVTLRLIRCPAHAAFASFAFAQPEQLVSTLCEITRAGVSCDLLAFDPRMAHLMRKRTALLMAPSADSGRANAQAVSPGEDFPLHVVAESRHANAALEDLAVARCIAVEHGAREFEATLPSVLRSRPFAPLNSLLGPDGERFAPMHGIVALSGAAACFAELRALLAKQEQANREQGVSAGFILTTLATNGFVIELVPYWFDRRLSLHEAMIDPSLIDRFAPHPPNPGGLEQVKAIRREVMEVYARYGAAHFQVGRSYPWLASLSASSRTLVEEIKRTLDPRGRLSPGVLGL